MEQPRKDWMDRHPTLAGVLVAAVVGGFFFGYLAVMTFGIPGVVDPR